MEVGYILLCNVIIALTGCVSTLVFLPKFRKIFVSSKLYSQDQNKKKTTKVADGFGITTTTIYLMCMVFFIPFAFMHENTGIDHIFDFVSNSSSSQQVGKQRTTEHFTREHLELVYYTAALLSICIMTLVGFIGDVLEHDNPFTFYTPLIALFPVLMVYYSTAGLTTILLPKFISLMLPVWYIHLGPLYYAIIILLALFYSNSIRILSGTNGLEAGQALVISASIIVFNFYELCNDDFQYHKFSLYFMIPFFTTTFGLLRINWYPAKVFVGDAFCASAGIIFATVGIFGHFCETMLMFFIPQIFNFFYSLPQFLRLLPFPEDRSPKFNPSTGFIEISMIRCNASDCTRIGLVIIAIMKRLRLVRYRRTSERETNFEFNNLNLPNFILLYTGPVTEKILTIIILLTQLNCSLYALAGYYFTHKYQLF